MNPSQSRGGDVEVRASSETVGHGEDDWEYEYDDTATEDFYFTLDLTTHVPDALVQTKKDPNDKSGPNASSGGGAANGHQQQVEKENSRPHDDEPGMSEVPGGVQIIDLHTRNPMVKFNDAIYSCYWSTDLGTQMHIARAGTVKDPRRAGNVLDVIGLSQARLLAKPVTLQRRDSPRAGHDQDAQSQSVVDLDESSDTEPDEGSDEPVMPTANVLPAPGQPLVIPRDLCKDSSAEVQASFLERLSAIKVKKGENDPIPIYNVKYYNGPSNEVQATIREQALEADAEKAKQAKDAKDAAAGEPPKKRRRRPTYAERGIERVNAKYGKRINGKSGRVRHEDVRAGLGYQLETESSPAQDMLSEAEEPPNEDQSSP